MWQEGPSIAQQVLDMQKMAHEFAMSIRSTPARGRIFGVTTQRKSVANFYLNITHSPLAYMRARAGRSARAFASNLGRERAGDPESHSQSGRVVIFGSAFTHSHSIARSLRTRFWEPQPERRAWVIGARVRRANAFDSSPATQISSFLLISPHTTSQGWVTQARGAFCNSSQLANFSLFYKLPILSSLLTYMRHSLLYIVNLDIFKCHGQKPIKSNIAKLFCILMYV